MSGRTVVRTSGNRKVGPHTVTTARTRDTCPTDCDAWAVCYGANVTQTGHDLFDNVGLAPAALTLTERTLAAAIGRKVTRAVRFNVVGDFLRDNGKRVDREYIAACNAAADAAAATIGPNGRPLPVWSYTHAWPEHPGREHVRPSDFTFTVRASASSLERARQADAAGWPVALIVADFNDPIVGRPLRADGTGPRVIPCPAQVRPEVTCETCGACARPSVAIAFAAHGTAARKTRPALPVFTHTA